MDRMLSQHGSMNDTATRFSLSGRPVGPKPSQLRDLGESGLVSSLHCIDRHSTWPSHPLVFLCRIMDQPHPLAQSSSPSVGVPPFYLYFPVLTHPCQAQNSVYITESTHNLNGNAPHSQSTAPNQSEELYKRSVMLVIWYKVSGLAVGGYNPTHP